MKSTLSSIVALILLLGCSNNNTSQEKEVAETTAQTGTVAASNPEESSGDGITGYWKLTLEAYDENGNKILDDAERKEGIQNRYSFRFNADGSCQIVESFKGRYEIKTENGIKKLYVFRNRIPGEEDKDPAPDVYRIISQSKTELVLLEDEGNLTFWVFQKAT